MRSKASGMGANAPSVNGLPRACGPRNDGSVLGVEWEAVIARAAGPWRSMDERKHCAEPPTSCAAAWMAGAALITAPMVLAFLVARRRFIQGITMTGFR